MSSVPQWNQNSNYAKELRKWDLPKSQGGMRPDSFQMFPKMVYRARRPDSGGPILSVDPRDEKFSAQNQLIVNSESEWTKAKDNGWRDTPQEAIAYANSLEDAVSMAAAHRAHEDKRMSEKAKAEAAAADAETAEHLPEIPEKRRVGRPRKVDPAA